MSHHINPYSYGPEVLGATPFNQMADTVWSGTESPYGPTFLSVDGLLDQASGHQILPDLVLLRLLEVAGLALAVAATPTLAAIAQTRPRPRRPDRGGIASGPAGSDRRLAQRCVDGRTAHGRAGRGQTLRHGARGDPVRTCRRGEIPGAPRCAVPRLGLGREEKHRIRRRIGHTAGAGLIALATMEVVSLVSGTGWGWIRTTTTADATFTGVTPINLVARVGLHRQPRGSGADLHLGRATRLHGARAARRRLRRVPPAAPVPAGRGRPLPGRHPAGPRAARPHRVVLVRDLGRDRGRRRQPSVDSGRPPS